MAFSREQLESLEKAAASGRLRVQFGNTTVQYQSLADLMNAIKMARADVMRAEGGHLRRYAQYSRG